MLTVSHLPQLEPEKRKNRREKGTKNRGDDTEWSLLLHPENFVDGGLLEKLETPFQAGASSAAVIGGCAAPPCGLLSR